MDLRTLSHFLARISLCHICHAASSNAQQRDHTLHNQDLADIRIKDKESHVPGALLLAEKEL